MRSASRSDNPVQTTCGYEGMSIFVIVLVLILCTYSCWISHCERAALSKFDSSMGVDGKGN